MSAGLGQGGRDDELARPTLRLRAITHSLTQEALKSFALRQLSCVNDDLLHMIYIKEVVFFFIDYSSFFFLQSRYT